MANVSVTWIAMLCLLLQGAESRFRSPSAEKPTTSGLSSPRPNYQLDHSSVSWAPRSGPGISPEFHHRFVLSSTTGGRVTQALQKTAWKLVRTQEICIFLHFDLESSASKLGIWDSIKERIAKSLWILVMFIRISFSTSSPGKSWNAPRIYQLKKSAQSSLSAIWNQGTWQNPRRDFSESERYEHHHPAHHPGGQTQGALYRQWRRTLNQWFWSVGGWNWCLHPQLAVQAPGFTH